MKSDDTACGIALPTRLSKVLKKRECEAITGRKRKNREGTTTHFRRMRQQDSTAECRWGKNTRWKFPQFNFREMLETLTGGSRLAKTGNRVDYKWVLQFFQVGDEEQNCWRVDIVSSYFVITCWWRAALDDFVCSVVRDIWARIMGRFNFYQTAKGMLMKWK